MNKIEQILHEVRSELGADFISTDVVGMNGISIAGGSIDPNFDASAASARFAMVAKLATKVVSKLNLQEMDELLITTDKAYIIVHMLGDGSFYWGIAVTCEATLGVVRMLMQQKAPIIWSAIPRN